MLQAWNKTRFFVVAGLVSGMLGLAGMVQPPSVMAKHATHKAAVKVASVNINTADAGTLAKVKGIKPATAKAIVAYRAKHGPFTSLDDLRKVKDVKAKNLGTLKSRLSI
ncbi:MAG: hypothetical protein BWK76_17905 [Desulfobulbaceae bacterium A2]|nr:MAG: hypothetical protein BWK76_17905 [Desulfobulbaceae bacterium A2]